LRLLLSIFLIPSLLIAEETVMPELTKDRESPATKLLPAGSILKKVLIPRYDKANRLTDVLRSAEMTIIDKQTFEGKVLRLELYNPDQTLRGRINLETARFNQKKGLLVSKQPVDIVSTDFSAHGTGLIYSQKRSQGFITGPVQTRLFAKPPKK
jgi:hypothetical protein